MPADVEGKVHLMMAESLDMAQRERKLNIPANHPAGSGGSTPPRR